MPVLAQEVCLGTAADLPLTAELAAEIRDRRLTFGLLANKNHDAFSQTLVADVEAHFEAPGVSLIVNIADFDANSPVFILGGLPARGEVGSVMNAASFQGSFDTTEAL